MDSGSIVQAVKSIIGEYIWILFGLFVMYFVKDSIANIIQGIMFFLDRDYNEQDIVLFNGRWARITKIGAFKTNMYMFDTDTLLKISNHLICRYMIEKSLPKRSNGANNTKKGV